MSYTITAKSGGPLYGERITIMSGADVERHGGRCDVGQLSVDVFGEGVAVEWPGDFGPFEDRAVVGYVAAHPSGPVCAVTRRQ